MISPAVAEPGRTNRPYSQRIQTFPMLSGEDQQTPVRRWRNNRDPAAARQLVASHLRLVAGIARRLQGYGIPLADLIGEGNIGLMKALIRFDPEHGSRFAAYAIWWIRAAMHEYVLRNWSLVKVWSTASQKKLFFNLRHLKARMNVTGDGDLLPDQVRRIAQVLDAHERVVVEMNRRLARDYRLNAAAGPDKAGDWQSNLVDEADRALRVLDPRERRSDCWRSTMVSRAGE